MAANYLIEIHSELSTSLDKQVDALPTGFNKARFVQNCMTVLQEGKADFSKCEPKTVVRTLLKGAFLGLDFFNGECYAIPYGGKVQFQTDYKGEKKLCKKYSIRKIKDIYAKVVKEGDVFEEKIVDGQQTVTFTPVSFNNGKILGAFAIVLYEDGGMEYETMSVEEIEQTRNDFSKAPNSDAWKKSFPEMCKKTVLRRLCKHIELDFETVEMHKLFESESDFDVHKQPETPQAPDVFTTSEEDIIDVEIVEEANDVFK